jgi:hypothetical protein
MRLLALALIAAVALTAIGRPVRRLSLCTKLP